MENYVKVVLYGYPLLKTVGEDYEAHIRNRAVLSHNSTMTAASLAEYLASEILEMQTLEWLKATVEKVLSGFLKIKAEEKGWSKRKYYRMQKRLERKITARLKGAGVTKEIYDKKLSDTDIFRKIHKFVEIGRDRKIAADEKRVLEGE